MIMIGLAHMFEDLYQFISVKFHCFSHIRWAKNSLEPIHSPKPVPLDRVFKVIDLIVWCRNRRKHPKPNGSETGGVADSGYGREWPDGRVATNGKHFAEKATKASKGRVVWVTWSENPGWRRALWRGSKEGGRRQPRGTENGSRPGGNPFAAQVVKSGAPAQMAKAKMMKVPCPLLPTNTHHPPILVSHRQAVLLSSMWSVHQRWKRRFRAVDWYSKGRWVLLVRHFA